MSAEYMKASFIPLSTASLGMITKQDASTQADPELALLKAQEEEALAQALDTLEQDYVQQQQVSNQKQVFKRLISEHRHAKTNNIPEQKETKQTVPTNLLKKLKLNQSQQQTIENFIKNPESLTKKEFTLDPSSFAKLSPSDIKASLKMAHDLAKSIDPKEVLTPVKNLLQGSNFGDNYLLAMAKASQALAETLQKIAQTDLEMQKFDNETIDDQIKNLQVMLQNILTDSKDLEHQINKSKTDNLLKKIGLCSVAALMIVVGGILEIAGGSGTGLIIAGVVLMASTLAAQYVQEGAQDFAGLFTNNAEEREKIATALTITVSVLVTLITAVFTCGASLAATATETALTIAGNVAKGVGQGLAMGAATFSTLGGASDIAYEQLDSENKGIDVRNDGDAELQSKAEKTEQTIGYITMAVGAAGGLMSMGGSGLVQLGLKSAAALEDDSMQMEELTNNDEEMNGNPNTNLSSEQLNEEASSNLQNESQTNENSAIKNLRKLGEKLAPNASKPASQIATQLAKNQWWVVGVPQLMGTAWATSTSILTAQAQLGAAYARLFIATDETTFEQGTKTIEMAQQGWQEDQTAVEAQTVGQVQQEGVRTNIEQDAMIQQAKIIAAVKA